MNAKIRLGPAGIPDRCNGGSIEGVQFIKKEGLHCIEIQFVRGVHMKNDMALELGNIAKELDVALSVHAPYYINLASSKKKTIEDSKKRIIESLERAHMMGAKIVVVHPGYYGNYSKEECHKVMIEQCQEISDVIKKNKWNPLLGLETTGKASQYGTLEEILDICKKVKYAAPVIDFGHLFAKQGGKIDYAEVLDKVKHFDHLHTHFANMKKNKDGGYSDIHMIMDNSPPFEPLAKEILKRKLDITIICETPVTDRDSLKMKLIFEKLGHKFIS